jgi:ABC-type uncharacterized transport system substrate-binding protein
LKNREKAEFSIAAALVALLVHAEPAAAHPHVWVTVRDTIVVESGAIIGVQHDWTFDEMYTAMAIEGLDTNHDGKYDRAELQPLAQTNIDGLKEFDNFTYANIGEKKLAFGSPRDYWLEYTNKILKLHFLPPFAEPIRIPVSNLKFNVEDPSYFIAFDFAKDDPVKLATGAPEKCKASLIQDPGTGDQQALTQAFGTQMSTMGTGITGIIDVTCTQ